MKIRILIITMLAVLLIVAFAVSSQVSYKRTLAEALAKSKEVTDINHQHEREEMRREMAKLRAFTITVEPQTHVEFETEAETETELESEEETALEVADSEDENEENSGTWIGEFRITWYSAEELIRQGYGSADGHTTASGAWAQENHTVAMSYDQRRALGISYGTRIWIDGMGEFVVEDCGCSWGTIDRFYENNPSDQEWPDNPYRNVWIVE